VIKAMEIGRFSGRTRRTEESRLITEIAEELKKTALELYLAHRKMPSRIVTCAHLSFSYCNIFLIMPGHWVTFERGTTEV
jgi:hypothetical protein